MKTIDSVEWSLLLDSNRAVCITITNWANGHLSSNKVSSSLRNTRYSAAFRHLIRTYGTMYGRRLARKAINYRREV